MLCALLVGCASNASTRPAPTPAILDGIYQFSEKPSQLPQPIEGTMTILRDTIWVDAQPGPCRYDDKRSWGNKSIVYRCAEMTVAIERLNPIRNATFSTTTTIDERKTVCVQYGTNAAGQRVCVQQETRMVPREITVTGMLRPVRVSRMDQP
jgi:hypothetical protein